ncbi:hypothetical protein VB005_09262 [Metarhizium brunneum]
MIFSMTPQVFSVLCLAVVSVAGQWTGNYNTTAVGRNTYPPRECLVETFNRGMFLCRCTGGKVFPGCSWLQWGTIFNSVRDANCKCGTKKDRSNEPKSLEAYGRGPDGETLPGVVRYCVCDPPAGKGDDSTDELVVPAPNCWCAAENLKLKTELSEAKESQGVPETPPSVDGQSTTQQPGEKQPGEKQPGQKQPATGSVQWCRDDLNRKKGLIQKNVCKELMEFKPKEMTPSMQRMLPNCSISSLTEICKDIPQD